jgi:signal transduction histidine kinase
LSIRLRLTIYSTAVIAAVLFTAGILIVALFSRESWRALDAALMEEADTTATALSQGGAKDTRPILEHLSREIDLGPGRRVLLTIDGRATFDGGDKHGDLVATSLEPATPRVMDGGLGRYRFAVVPLRLNGRAACLWDGVDADPVRRTVEHLRHTLLAVIPVILALCIAAGYWTSARALEPVNDVTQALTGIGPRDLQRRLPVARVQDEAGRLVEAINELLERLAHASASQKRFVSEAAHELRTPLTVLRSGLEVTLQKPRSADESRAALEQALGEVVRLCSIAEDLLALARLDAEPGTEREPVDLGEMAREASAMAQTLAEAKHHNLRLNTCEGAVVQGSSRDLRRVVLNLLDNAIKFTPQQGSIEIAISREASTALIKVQDNGPGVDPLELPHIFDPFFRSRSATNGGSGLGLALSREIVRLHNGTIEAANRAGGGCEILVHLPLANL